ncbi:MAG: thiamine-phosphate kinase [Candidatus Omnitrophica bacterium]|nr:thiamine-phosphate kinase [Candidatus Omnitrophota bacterium]
MKTLNAIGEFGLIEQIRGWVKKADKSVVMGIGDDAAVLRLGGAKDLLFTTDMLIEDRHFRRGEATAYEIGRKALAVNVSDIAAMGGAPQCAVVALGVPSDLRVDFVKDLYKGMNDLARAFGVKLVGGDTNHSDKIIISVALLGEVGRGKAALRSGAKAGDVVFVTGELGGSYSSKKHLNFTPRIKEARYLTEHFKIHAMMDLSDGLASDLTRMSQASRVGFILSEDAIPVSKYENLQKALTDGEDFELLFTLAPRDAAKLTLTYDRKKMAPIHPIGKVVEKKYGLRILKKDGTYSLLEGKGFEHF